MTELKKCINCERTLPITEFGRNRANKDGRQVYCKDCTNKMKRNYRKIVLQIERAKKTVRGSDIRKKYCPNCNRMLPVILFAIDSSQEDNRACLCNMCVKKNIKN